MNERQSSFADIENWELPPLRSNAVEIGALQAPIWTETKAQLIQNYLRLFLYITRHGTYIDGFAGPQDGNNPSSWAAKLALELSPPWMKDFFLCELNEQSSLRLQEMVDAQPRIRGRSIRTKSGDFNAWIDTVLASGAITDSTATFALLDQRSTECHWETVRRLASHKQGSTKIELFYFFPTGWVHRALSETQDKKVLDRWWGDDGWRSILEANQARSALMAQQKIQALGYANVMSWPICAKEHGAGRTMYHMIHATDHLEAPKLMYRAYKNLVGGVLPDAQIPFTFE